MDCKCTSRMHRAYRSRIMRRALRYCSCQSRSWFIASLMDNAHLLAAADLRASRNFWFRENEFYDSESFSQPWTCGHVSVSLSAGKLQQFVVAVT